MSCNWYSNTYRPKSTECSLNTMFLFIESFYILIKNILCEWVLYSRWSCDLSVVDLLSYWWSSEQQLSCQCFSICFFYLICMSVQSVLLRFPFPHNLVNLYDCTCHRFNFASEKHSGVCLWTLSVNKRISLKYNLTNESWVDPPINSFSEQLSLPEF